MKQVIILPGAAKALRKHRAEAARIVSKVEDYAREPASLAKNVKALTGSRALRLRVGDYRVVLEETETEIIVTAIGPRGSVHEQREPTMNVRFFRDDEGREMAVLPRTELDALAQVASHAEAVADYRSGRLPGLSPAEALAFAQSSSPLAFWRKYRGLTQAALAGRAGISQNYLSDIENGKRSGPVELWVRFGKALDLPVEHLLEAE